MMLGGAAISIWGLRFLGPVRSLRQFTAAAGVALQLGVFWWQWTTWSRPESVYAEPELAQFLGREVGTTGRLAMEPSPWAEAMFPPNMLMPSGVAITGGYDAIQPFGMKSPSGNSWDFPGATHFLGEVTEDGPVGWAEIWSDGRWRVMRNPEQSEGIVKAPAGETPLPRERFARPTLNTMEVLAPAGTTKLTLYTNWHRGWRWRDTTNESWKPVGKSADRSVEVYFVEALPADRLIKFRYDPSPPRWTLVLALASLLGIAALATCGPRHKA